MLWYEKYETPNINIIGKRNKFDNNIYTFDIETSSYYLLNDIIYPAITYDKLTEDEKKEAKFYSSMYIWMFGINDIVYYGRTWYELKIFLTKLEMDIPEKKYVFIHNLGYEFQYLRGHFKMEKVVARKARKVMTAEFEQFNIECRCSYMLSGVALEKLPKLYNLNIKKLNGYLDYDKIRTYKTPLSEKELMYCENDCLVLYEYIKFELTRYENVKKIPLTNTGKVRRELKNLTMEDWSYKGKVKKAINTDPHIYNLLIEAFAGGYTHANWIYTDEVLEDVESWDETSAYPYVMVTHRFPSKEFKKCNIKKYEQLNKNFAYLIKVKMNNIKSKFYNNILSMSKCRNIRGAKYDNGRIISADELETTVTDVDFKLLYDFYDFEYEFIEVYYSVYNYLPIQFINFILDKYVEKTKYKDVAGMELEYQISKGMFNSLYGMSVTNMIKDRVIYDNASGWHEEELTNEEIIEALEIEKKKSFLSFAYGVWVTAFARNNLLRNMSKLDDYIVYCDTDSMKLAKGYSDNSIKEYNEFVKRKIEFVSKRLEIPIEKFAPSDSKGVSHMIGLFEFEKKYEEFITQGAKKYAVKVKAKDKLTGEEKEEIKITVAGVPKEGAKALESLEDFKDGLLFKYEDTGKKLVIYNDQQEDLIITDYLGEEALIEEPTGIFIGPNSYVLGKALDYVNLISDNSSKRAIFKE